MSARVRTIRARLFPHGELDVLRQVLLFAAAYYAYRLVRGIVDDSSGAAIAFQHGREIIGLERTLHLFIEPSVQAWAQTKPAIIDAASWLYLNAQTTVTVGALVYFYLVHNRQFYFLRNMFVIAMGVALIGYIVFPTAPPRFFPEWGFFDSVEKFTGVGHTDKVNALFNPYAAIPSMHVCFSLLIGVPLSRLAKHRPVRIFWALYPLLVTFVIVSTANHFLSDAILGAFTAGIAAFGARWLGRTRPAVWAWTPRGDAVPVSGDRVPVAA